MEVAETPDMDWNKRLLASPFGTIYHTKEYAEYTRKRLDWEPLFIRCIDGKGDVTGQMLLFKHTRLAGKIRQPVVGKLLSKVAKSVMPEYRWVYGPVILREDRRDAVYQEIGELLLQMKGRINGSVHPLDNGPNALDKLGFRRESWGTFLIDLRPEKENLWASLDKKSAKKNVERSGERNVTVREMTGNDLDAYFRLQSETRAMLDLQEYKYGDVADAWSILGHVGFTGFMAFKGDMPLSALLVSTFNGYVNEWGVARSRYDLENKMYSQDLIKWEIIKWGHDNGYRYFDLTGVNPRPADEKEKGIYTYKEKWGGMFVEYPTYRGEV